MSRLIVVSNRVDMAKGKGGAATGGLAMALASALRTYKGIWFGWSGRVTPSFDGLLAMQRIGGVMIATVDLEEPDVEEYYNGYANRTLWPLFHSRIDLTAYDRTFDQGYARVNARLAQTLAPLIEADDIIWVHDYHLLPFARELRKRGCRNPIGFFLHIPWPSRDLLMTLPRHQQLVESLFDYDLVGFQTEEWLEAFQIYVLKELGGVVLPHGRMRAFDKTIRASAFPIGIDVESFQDLARSPAALKMQTRVRESGPDRAMIIGVDRLDYSKGLEERFAAYERFLADNPARHQKVFLLQIAPPTREGVLAYQEIRARLDSSAGHINGVYAEPDWAPVRYVNRGYRRDELAGLYQMARVGLVTPLRDGMNLVAKEFVAAQHADDPGVLILSRFAGAAQQMREALIVNPFSKEEVADAMERALSMPLEQRRARHEKLLASVRAENVTWWRDAFVSALANSRAGAAAAA